MSFSTTPSSSPTPSPEFEAGGFSWTSDSTNPSQPLAPSTSQPTLAEKLQALEDRQLEAVAFQEWIQAESASYAERMEVLRRQAHEGVDWEVFLKGLGKR